MNNTEEIEAVTLDFISLPCTSITQNLRHEIAEADIQKLVSDLNEKLTLYHQQYCYAPNVISYHGNRKEEGLWFEIDAFTAIACSQNGSIKEQDVF